MQFFWNRQGFQQGGDADSAKALVRVVSPEGALERIISDAEAHLSQDKEIVCVVPVPAFVRPTISNNLIPWAYAAYVAKELGGTIGHEIVQRARVGRTNLTDFQRLVWQPWFTGSVKQDAAYIIVDDVLHWGGTLAALRSYIVAQGGTVCAVTALAHGSGNDRSLALSQQTCDRLIELFGADFRGFWEREIGHDAFSLTEAEGRFLLRWADEQGAGIASLHGLRTRLLEAAGQGE